MIIYWCIISSCIRITENAVPPLLDLLPIRISNDSSKHNNRQNHSNNLSSNCFHILCKGYKDLFLADDKYFNILQGYIMQRMLNKDYGLNMGQLTFISDLRMQDLMKFIEITSEICEKCRINKKTHYCMQQCCEQRELICWNCDPHDINSQHYLHEYAYCLPLFGKNILENFLQIKTNLVDFQKYLLGEMEKISAYLKKLGEISEMTGNKIMGLQQEYERSMFVEFERKIQEFKEYHLKKGDAKREDGRRGDRSRIKFDKDDQFKLKDFFKKIKFYSAQQCMKIEQQISRDLIESVNNLEWVKNPQKDLKTLLQTKNGELKKDLFLGSDKKIQFSEIDHIFKLNNEFLTENMKTHKIELKIQSEFLSKTKSYQALIYHLRDARKISIDNALMNQIRTPLTFKNLQEFQFSCNTESEPLNMRIENVSEDLESLVVRKLREEEVRILKTIVQNTRSLKKLHLQFFNKWDLSGSKQIGQFLSILNQNPDNNLIDFHFKMRTEGEVKRMYGYLAKFYKEPTPEQNKQNNTLACLITSGIRDLLNKNSNKIYRICIDGVKNLVNVELLSMLEQMPNLTFLRIKYDGLDSVCDCNIERGTNLLKKCYEKRKSLAILGKYEKNRKIPRKSIDQLIYDFLL